MQTMKQLDVSLQVYLHVTVIDPDQVTGGSTIIFFFIYNLRKVSRICQLQYVLFVFQKRIFL